MKLDKVLPIIPRISNRWDVPNQFVIEMGNGIQVFQSYASIIAVRADDGVFLDKYRWDYSRTTGKYRNLFLGCDKKECERRIETGLYKLVDLNGAD